MIPYYRALLSLAGFLLFLFSAVDAHAANAVARVRVELATVGAASPASYAGQLGQESTVTGRTTSRAPRSTYVPTTGSSGGGTCSSTITARPGDTLSSIARRCGVSTSSLANGNRLSPSSSLGVGQTLLVPSGRPQVQMAPTRVPVRPTRSYTYP